MASRTERMMVTASCSVNKDKELSASGEFKGGVSILRKTRNALRDRQCWVVDLYPDIDFL